MNESVLLTDDHPVDPDDELLVAYLDSELDDDQRKSVEKRLVGEISFRQRLQALQTGWEWLDDLPSESTSEKLLESTIELVVADIKPASVQQNSWLVRNWKKVAFVSALMAALAIGLAGTKIARDAALAAELKELAIAEDHKAYSLGRNFSFFHELANNRQWEPMLAAMEQVGGRSMAPPSIVDAIPLDQRAERIQTLPTKEREKLEVRWKTYSGYSEEAKQDIRKTAARIEQREDGELLLRTMKAASVWLEGLSETLRDELQSDDKEVRKAAIDYAIAFTMADLFRDSGKLISDDTSDRIYLWLLPMLQQRLSMAPDLVQRIESAKEESTNPGRTEELVHYYLLRVMVGDRELRNRGGIGGGRIGPGFGGPSFGSLGLSAFMRPPSHRPPGMKRDGENPRPGGERRPRPTLRIPGLTDDEIEGLKNVLSDEALSNLNALTSMSTELAGNVAISDMLRTWAAADTLRTWAVESVKRNAPDFGSDEMTPLDRYRARQDRETLDLRPPDEIIDEIFARSNWWRSSTGRPR